MVLETRNIDIELENITERDEFAHTLEQLIEARKILNNNDDVIKLATQYSAL